MVTDSMRKRRQDDSADDHRRDRGQVILIGAITLAFIVLGVVVVFNGVLYTETLSSADTGQTASGADATELEVRQGVACVATVDTGDNPSELFDNDGSLNESHDYELDGEIENYTKLYRNATVHSQPAAVNVAHNSGTVSDLFADGVNVTVEYDSSDLSYERSLDVTADECPNSPSIEEFNITSTNDNNYTVDWAVSSSPSELSSMNISLYDENHSVIDSDEPEEYDGESEFEDDGDGGEADYVRIIVTNEAGYAAIESEDINGGD